jgi:hypothetical protein
MAGDAVLAKLRLSFCEFEKSPPAVQAAKKLDSLGGHEKQRPRARNGTQICENSGANHCPTGERAGADLTYYWTNNLRFFAAWF